MSPAPATKRGSMSDTATPYALKRTLQISFEEADRKVRAALQDEGFGVLTEIDVQATLKEKLDVDHRPYRILGACNPPLAHQALSADIDVGLLLPCNVVVYEGEEEGTSVVAAMDPEALLRIADSPVLDELAADVTARLERALAAL